MINLWLIFGVTVIGILALIPIGIYLFKKKEKYYKLSLIVLIGLGLFCIISDIPYIKDIAKQETIEITAVYTEWHTNSPHPGARHLWFKSGGQEFRLLAPTITQEHINMEIGKRYRIEYFVNTNVIKSYELIE